LRYCIIENDNICIRLSESGYFRAKVAHEKLIKESSIPFSIVHATQFFEFLKGLADISFDGEKVSQGSLSLYVSADRSKAVGLLLFAQFV
jgi:uncharacterized protein YbjT (DUF2867 family)